MSDLDYDALRKVAEAATPGPWEKGIEDAQADMPPDYAIWMPEVGHDGALVELEADAEHIAAFDPPTVLRLLDLAQCAEADRAAVERVRALADDLWRVAPCGCGHRADLHTMGGIDSVSVCTGGLGICGCDWSFVRIVQQRIRDAVALDPQADQ